jgi:transcriptional regulator with XRE-family HTH domain
VSPAQAFGERLAQERREKAAREHRDITQRDVARAVGLTSAAISNYEKGGTIPNDDILAKLAAFYGVRPSWLRYGEGEKLDVKAPARSGSALNLDPSRDRRATDEELDRAERIVAAKAESKRLLTKQAGAKGKGRS